MGETWLAHVNSRATAAATMAAAAAAAASTRAVERASLAGGVAPPEGALATPPWCHGAALRPCRRSRAASTFGLPRLIADQDLEPIDHARDRDGGGTAAIAHTAVCRATRAASAPLHAGATCTSEANRAASTCTSEANRAASSSRSAVQTTQSQVAHSAIGRTQAPASQAAHMGSHALPALHAAQTPS